MQKQTFWNILPYLPKHRIFLAYCLKKWGCFIIMHRVKHIPFVDAFLPIEYCERGLFCICDSTVSESVLSLHVPESKNHRVKITFKRLNHKMAGELT
jgi:hypothetical protein